MSDKKLFTLTTLAAAALAGSVQAQSASGFYMTGFVEGGTTSTIPVSYEGDITLGYDGIAGMPMGVELGLNGYGSSGGSLTSLTGVIYYDTDFGRFSVGKPRAAVDDYITETAPSHLPAFNFPYKRFYASDTSYYMQSSSGDFLYGLRFDGSFSGIDYGLSYHALTGGDYILTAGASYGFGDYYTVGLGVEQTPMIVGTNYNFFGSIKAEYDNFGASLMLKHHGNPSGSSALTYLGNVYYDWNDLEVYADYLVGVSGGGATYIVGAKYTFFENGYAGVEAFGDTGGGFSSFYNIYAGWNFAIGG